MEENYKIYDLSGNLLEKIDKLSNCSYGKPGYTKEHAERTGKKCYFIIIPYSPMHIRVCKETHERLGGGEAVWSIQFEDPMVGWNFALVRNEADIKPVIDRLTEKFNGDVNEDNVKVSLKRIR